MLQWCGTSVSLVGVRVAASASVRRLLHRGSWCGCVCLAPRHPPQASRHPRQPWPASTQCLLRPPSLITADLTRRYCVELDEVRFEQVCEETLESLSEYLEELVASDTAPQDSDVLYSTGVLTLQLGSHGTYVINKQTPNKQIWLSSPVSGPKRFDFLGGVWTYRHTGDTLHGLLNTELAGVFSPDVDFLSCAHGKGEKA